MAAEKYYVIKYNVVQNVIICDDDTAQQLNLIKFPVTTSYGVADTNWTYIDGSFLPPPRDILAEWAAVRRKRDFLLAESDVAVLPDKWATYTTEQQQVWANYRQQLRDIPQNFVDPQEIVFPVKPE